ncbi:MAG: hypothetical protein CM15mP92_2150 [Halieaceae bacterium]|nr:MAG: hypothetical protein CM15mP92_2150 [Halieaceae bacterium]
MSMWWEKARITEPARRVFSVMRGIRVPLFPPAARALHRQASPNGLRALGCWGSKGTQAARVSRPELPVFGRRWAFTRKGKGAGGWLTTACF